MPQYKVSLPGVPPLDVEAASPEEAFETYKKSMGVTMTKRTPLIEEHTGIVEPAEETTQSGGKSKKGSGKSGNQK